MADKIEFDYNGSTYTLEFDRKSIMKAEEVLGLDMNALTDDNIKFSMFPKFFHAALLKHHPRMKESTVDMLYGKLKGKQELFECVASMYVAAARTLFEDPEEGEAISWTMA